VFSQNLTQLRVNGANTRQVLDNTSEPPEDTTGAADAPDSHNAAGAADAPDSHNAAIPAISFKNVSFSYKEGEKVIDDITFNCHIQLSHSTCEGAQKPL